MICVELKLGILSVCVCVRERERERERERGDIVILTTRCY